MLLNALLGFMYSRVGITTVVLSGRIVAVSHVVITVVALGSDMWIRGVIVNGAVTSVRDRVVAVRILPVHVHVVGLQLVVGVRRGCGHLHLPQRVLRVDAAAVVRVGVAVLQVTHVSP